MTPEVIFYDVKCCRNCRNGHKYQDKQTCKNPTVIEWLRNHPIGYDPQISMMEGEQRAFVHDHSACNFHEFRSDSSKQSYLRARSRIIEYSERVECEVIFDVREKEEAELREKCAELRGKYGAIPQGKHR